MVAAVGALVDSELSMPPEEKRAEAELSPANSDEEPASEIKLEDVAPNGAVVVTVGGLVDCDPTMAPLVLVPGAVVMKMPLGCELSMVAAGEEPERKLEPEGLNPDADADSDSDALMIVGEFELTPIVVMAENSLSGALLTALPEEEMLPGEVGEELCPIIFGKEGSVRIIDSDPLPVDGGLH